MPASPRPYLLGLDIGTSGVKALALAPGGALLASASAPLSLQAPRPGWAEQDPEAWWTASRKALASLLTSASLRGRRPLALGLSGQMHSSVFLDARGQVVRPALLWCDGRTTAECRDITRAVGEGQLRRWVCNPALEGFTLPKLLWLRRHEPAAWRRVAKVLLPKDYIRFRLSGTLASDYSDAAGTLMLDVAQRRWCLPLLKALRLDAKLLPELGESGQELGRLSPEAARSLGLPSGLPLAGGGADNACGALGVGAVDAGTAVASWGTSGTLLAPTAKPVVDPGLRAHTFCSALPKQWYVMGVMLQAGGAFAWYRQQLAGGAEALALNREAESVPIGAEGLSFLPYLQGERTPHRDAAARGALAGLSFSHTRAHVSRAVLEGVAFGLRDSLEILRAMRLPLRRLLLTGGGARAPFLRRLQAEVYGLPVQTVDKEEGPAYGAALLAGLAAGVWRDAPQAARATLKRRPPLRPRAAAQRDYTRAYRRWKALYPALKAWAPA